MSDHEAEHKEAPDAPRPADPWSIWFSRLVQVVGLAIMVYETLVEHTDRPWLLLSAMAMLLGGLGLQLIVRWALGRGLGSIGQ